MATKKRRRGAVVLISIFALGAWLASGVSAQDTAVDQAFERATQAHQHGDLEGAVRAGLDEHRAGLIVSSSRAICYASAGDDFQEAARAAAVGFRDAIEQVRHEA